MEAFTVDLDLTSCLFGDGRVQHHIWSTDMTGLECFKHSDCQVEKLKPLTRYFLPWNDTGNEFSHMSSKTGEARIENT